MTRAVERMLGRVKLPHPQRYAFPQEIHFPTWMAILGVVCVWAVLEVWGLGLTPFHTKGEPREGLVVWEMTHGGRWILPLRNGTEIPSKPPLFHWIGAITSSIRGVTDEWSIRFPSVLCSLVSVLAICYTGARLWSVRAGVLAALCVLTTVEWARAAVNARVDMVLTCGLTGALLALLFFFHTRRSLWLIPLYGGIIMAMLAKGPVGAAIPGAITLAMCVTLRDFRVLREMRLGIGVIVVAVGVGWWYAFATFEGGEAFWIKHALSENVLRVLGGPQFEGGHQHGILYLLGVWLVGTLPWTLFAPLVIGALWQQRGALHRHDPRVYCLVWIAVVFAFYGAAESKRSVYLLALYPAVALLLGWWWDERLLRRDPLAQWAKVLLQSGTVLFSGVLMLLGVTVCVVAVGGTSGAMLMDMLPESGQHYAAPLLHSIQSAAGIWVSCLVGAVFAMMVCVWRVQRMAWSGVLAGYMLAVALLIILIQQVALPSIAAQKTTKDFMATIRSAIEPGHTIFFYKMFDYGAIFYWRGHIPTYEGTWPIHAPKYLLMRHRDWQASRAAAGDWYVPVAYQMPPEVAAGESLVLLQRNALRQDPLL